MITMPTLEAIYHAMREIESGKKLLADLRSDRARREREVGGRALVDAFGRERPLSLGVPSGESAHTLYRVSPHLAESVILAHIAAKEAELVEANERARIELEKP